MSEACHSARSPAKNTPAHTSSGSRRLAAAMPGAAAGETRWRRSSHAHTASGGNARRSEEHTSELQSHSDLVCRLLLEKKKIKPTSILIVTATQKEPAPTRTIDEPG